MMPTARTLALVATLSAALAACGESDPEARRTRCAECHGERAQGTDKGPPLVDPAYRSAHHADLAFHFAVRDGVKQHHWHFGDMPPQPNVTPEGVGHVTAHVRGLQRQAGIR